MMLLSWPSRDTEVYTFFYESAERKETNYKLINVLKSLEITMQEAQKPSVRRNCQYKVFSGIPALSRALSKRHAILR